MTSGSVQSVAQRRRPGRSVRTVSQADRQGDRDRGRGHRGGEAERAHQDLQRARMKVAVSQRCAEVAGEDDRPGRRRGAGRRRRRSARAPSSAAGGRRRPRSTAARARGRARAGRRPRRSPPPSERPGFLHQLDRRLDRAEVGEVAGRAAGSRDSGTLSDGSAWTPLASGYSFELEVKNVCALRREQGADEVERLLLAVASIEHADAGQQQQRAEAVGREVDLRPGSRAPRRRSPGRRSSG